MSAQLKVTFCVMNLRMGGQVSNLLGLLPMLRERGIDASLALPEGLATASKQDLANFGSLPSRARAVATLRMLRSLPTARGHVVHLVLPTPSFSPLCYLASTPLKQMIVQSEGLPTRADSSHLRLLWEDPRLFAPRMVLNHRLLVEAARRVPVRHLVTAESYRTMLLRAGFPDVTCVENVARFESFDQAPLPSSLQHAFGPGRRVVGYIGHCHPVKGVYDLLEAFQLAATESADLHLVLALSEDGSAKNVRRAVAGLPVAVRSRVHLCGLVPVHTLLARLDALVLPYRSIATTTIYPSLLLEADEAGCPVIVAEVAPLPDILPEDDAFCVRVAPRDVQGLAKAIRRTPARAARTGAPARLRLRKPSERLNALVSLYENTAGLKSSASLLCSEED